MRSAPVSSRPLPSSEVAQHVKSMTPHPENRPTPSAHEMRLAKLRVVLGTLQMLGASFGVTLLFLKGVNNWTVGVAIGTACCTLVSRVIFHKRDRREAANR